MKDNNESIALTVRKIFTEYLQARNLRKTPERFAILQEIYSSNGHFDIEDLYNRMKDRKYRVSRATLYNTIELLLDCELVIKHQFGHNCAQYERSYKFRQHDHFVDLETGQVMEYCDPRLLEIQKTIEEELGVVITHHSLVFYGYKKKENGTAKPSTTRSELKRNPEGLTDRMGGKTKKRSTKSL